MSYTSTLKPTNSRPPESGQSHPWTNPVPTPEPKLQSPAFSESIGDPSDAARLSLLPEEAQFLEAALAHLTSREREVVLAICSGGTNEAIASRLCIALPTLRTHLMRLNQKLRTTSKGDVVRYAATILIAGYRSGSLSALNHP
ncbi:MAG: helix-turn-helix transcriptional regulator [Phycisphaerae bacterium]|nr:helix-turn-helix transcriptional regulator [Phycisphaerae bacterium]